MSIDVKPNVKTWKVLRWDDEPPTKRALFLACHLCENDAQIEIGPTPGGRIIAALGLGLIFDPADYKPPENFMPTEIQCRHCRKIFSSLGDSDVR